ncbi:MAG: glycoside hydrolase family 31 protein [Anaerolineae bacterium]
MHILRDHAPLLTIRHVSPRPSIERWAHGEIWHGVDEIAIELGNDHWYGQGALVHQQWPLEKLAQYEAPFLTSDNGHTGLLGYLVPFWFNSAGAGVLAESDALITSFNRPLAGEPPAHSFWQAAPADQRPRLAADVPTDGLLTIRGEGMTLRFFALDSPRAVVEAFWEMIPHPPAPPADHFGKPLWTTWAHFKNDISHDRIMDYLAQMEAHGFPCGTFGIDAKWQDVFGNTRFDPVKFPDPQATVDAFHARGMKVTLWCMPFIREDSEHFQPAAARGYLIKQAESDAPYIGTWWEGQAGLLDVTNPEALAWHLDNLQRLAGQYGIDGFKFDAGEAMFYDIPGTRRHNPAPLNRAATHHYVTTISRRYPWSDTRSAWWNQGAPMLFRQWDKNSVWGYDNGLASCLTQALTLNMLGYPYHFPDMIGGNAYYQEPLDAEIMIRWTQAVAPMPFIQFSIAPWQFGDECAALCARYAQVHAEIAPRHVAQAQAGGPLLRPLWWIENSEAAFTCADEYLVGDDLLVAPVLTPGATTRDIYLPAGTWRSYWHAGETHRGGQWLRDYPAPLEVLPLFERIEA